MPKFTVAIIGAGLSGLTFAIALQKYAPDVDFTIYEGTSQRAEIGAGIGMQQRPWTIMRALGLDGDLSHISGNGKHQQLPFTFRKADQPEGVELVNVDMAARQTEKTFTFHRADLQRVFLNHLDPQRTIRVAKRLAFYEAGTADLLQLRFQDGSTATCDILVGSDGVRSTVRSSMYSELADPALSTGNGEEATELRSHIPAMFSGFVVYRNVIRKEMLDAETVAHPALNRTAFHLVTYPISQGRALNVGAMVHRPDNAGNDAENSGGRHLKGASKWTINTVKPLPPYVHSNVALMGDAAHAMTPHQAAGVGQGFEDGFLLAQLLGRADVTREKIAVALQVYDEIRRPLSQKVAVLSLRLGALSCLDSPEFAHLTVEESATGTALSSEQLDWLGEEVERSRDWRKSSSILGENERALRRMDEVMASC
ncbi:FAD/NAD(P)-binding domain-containing protein [Daedaleopsis nitida]|nr:FAD/NAD(P)-binding domain-containing protein [Daedaleopsis nitida]